MVLAEMFEKLMRILDHDDGRVHHRADGNRDASQGHDVRGDAELIHRQEGKDDGDGQREDGDQSRADVPKEHETDERDHDAFLDELLAQRGDGSFDELAAVISGDQFHALGQR